MVWHPETRAGGLVRGEPVTPKRLARTWAAIGASVTTMVLTACTATADAGPPACSAGRGTHHQTATLALAVDGDQVHGTYRVTSPQQAGTYLVYTVTGTADHGHLESDWQLGSEGVHATGTYTATTITLDNPGHQFGIDHFTKANGCPSA